jgi:hypothetical protein
METAFERLGVAEQRALMNVVASFEMEGVTMPDGWLDAVAAHRLGEATAAETSARIDQLFGVDKA